MSSRKALDRANHSGAPGERVNNGVDGLMRSTVRQPNEAGGGARLLLGLIGSGIQASLTPAMQMREAAEQGALLHYQTVDLDRTSSDVSVLPELVRSMRTIGFDGFNVTFPCKQAIIPLLDDIADDARAIGAVNTVVRNGNQLTGYNTDCSGWRWGFERSLPDADLGHAVLLGAGGAGSAIAEALMRMNASQLSIVDADPQRAMRLAHSLSQRHGNRASGLPLGELPRLMARASGLVHATPTGMLKLPGLPIAPELLEARHWVSEIVYFPIETALLQAARQRGCAVCDGGGMAVGQAIDAFKLFTGRAADAARVERHFANLLQEQSGAETYVSHPADSNQEGLAHAAQR